MNTPLEKLVSTLETFGSDSRHWPADVRIELEALVANSADARAAVAEATQLDAWLDSLADPEPAPALAARIVAELPARAPLRARPAMRRALFALPLAAAALLALWVQPPFSRDSNQPAATARLASLPSQTEAFPWEMPSDVLLDVASLDPVDNVPPFDCLYDEHDCMGVMEDRESLLETQSRNLT